PGASPPGVWVRRQANSTPRPIKIPSPSVSAANGRRRPGAAGRVGSALVGGTAATRSVGAVTAGPTDSASVVVTVAGARAVAAGAARARAKSAGLVKRSAGTGESA